ncbi:MAG: hypothetical protein ACREE3_13425, partial [Stellaceae bacterium]
AGGPCMPLLPSKFLSWSHEPITSPLEMTAINNFHHLRDATAERMRGDSAWNFAKLPKSMF